LFSRLCVSLPNDLFDACYIYHPLLLHDLIIVTIFRETYKLWGCYVRFEVFTVVTMKNSVFWVSETSCFLVSRLDRTLENVQKPSNSEYTSWLTKAGISRHTKVLSRR
jgi:hypothetical protein